MPHATEVLPGVSIQSIQSVGRLRLTIVVLHSNVLDVIERLEDRNSVIPAFNRP